jgi:hypothetical protein
VAVLNDGKVKRMRKMAEFALFAGEKNKRFNH